MPKLATAPRFSDVEDVMPAEPREVPRESWGMCAGCDRERPLEPGPVLRQHRAWRTFEQVMVPCAGSGDAPTVVTT